MTRFNNGDVDSPMAKRGCIPRSSSMTDRPARRAIIASSEPENPEPIMARSKSLLICTISNPHVVFRSHLAAGVAGVDRAHRFNQEYLAFVLGDRSVLNSPGNDKHFPCFEVNSAV